MKFSAIIWAALPAAALFMTATNSAAEEPTKLDYMDSMRCMAVYSLLSAAIEGQEGTTAAEVAAIDDITTRWIFLAMMRDGEAGKKMERDIEPAIDSLVKKIESYGDDGTAAEKFLDGVEGRCQAIQTANATEFNAVDVDAMNAEEAADEGKDAG